MTESKNRQVKADGNQIKEQQKEADFIPLRKKT
jgi:hypothetical protein